MAWAPETYVSIVDLRAYLRIDDAVDDLVLFNALAAASRAVDKACNRQFGQVDSAGESRLYTGRYDVELRRWVVDIDDLQDTTVVMVFCDDGSGTFSNNVTQFSLRPSNAVLKGGVYTQLAVPPSSPLQLNDGEDQVEITAKWGWIDPPSAILQAVTLQASRFVGRRDSPFGIAGNADAGAERIVSARVDPDVAVSLRPYYRWEGTVR